MYVFNRNLECRLRFTIRLEGIYRLNGKLEIILLYDLRSNFVPNGGEILYWFAFCRKKIITGNYFISIKFICFKYALNFMYFITEQNGKLRKVI